MTMTCQPTQAAQPWITISSKIAGFLKTDNGSSKTDQLNLKFSQF
jgi:hypothetical protein